MTFIQAFKEITPSRDVSSSKAHVRRIHREIDLDMCVFEANHRFVEDAIDFGMPKIKKSNLDRKINKLFDPLLQSQVNYSPYKASTYFHKKRTSKFSGNFIMQLPTIANVSRVDYEDKSIFGALMVRNSAIVKNGEDMQVGCDLGGAVIFSDHSIERYMQRANDNTIRGLFDTLREADSNAEMMHAKSNQYVTIPCKQGVFFGEKITPGEIMVKTFVSNTMLFSNQLTLCSVITSRLDDIRDNYNQQKYCMWIEQSLSLREFATDNYTGVRDELMNNRLTKIVSVSISCSCAEAYGLTYDEDAFAIFDPQEAIYRDVED